MKPPASLSKREATLWVKMRDDEAHGVIPTPADGELLAQRAKAQIRLDDAEELAKQKKLPKSITLAGTKKEIRFWSNQVRLLTVKCKFLREESNYVEEKDPNKDNLWADLIHINQKKIDTSCKSKFVDAANRYAEEVISGKVSANKKVKQACQRHLDDLRRKNFPYKFSAYLADRACRIISNLPHVKGKWAKKLPGKSVLLKLEDWQCFVVCSLFGWVRKSDNMRRFTEAYLEICRKNGKSILAAAIAIIMFCCDEEHGAEVFSGATTEKQAWEVFRPARLMLKNTPLLCAAAGITVHAKSILRDEDQSRFEPLIGNPGDGASPSCAIVDEYHEHDSPNLVDTMVTGMLAREQPLLLKITTSGYNIAGPCYEDRTKAIQVLDRALEDERKFVLIYGIDEPNDNTGEKGDDWASPAAVQKANPNLGVSVDEEFLLAQQRSAVVNVSEQTKFKTKHLNVWCAARQSWISLQHWISCGDNMLQMEELKGCSNWFSFDLASKLDIAARMMLFRKRMQERNHYYLFGRYYLPEDRLHEPGKNQLMYQKWHRQGLLTATHGSTTDFERIKDDMLTDARLYAPSEVVFDPFNATHMAQLLIGEGLNLVEFTQTASNFAVPMDEVTAAMKDGRMHHDGNEMLTWMMSNVTLRPAKKGLFSPAKESPEQKIDGPVAFIMCVARALADDSDSAMDQLFGNAVTA